MAFHHVAIATRDLEATHRFYSAAMGFALAKAVAGKTGEGGWAKHLFYDTGGGGLIAFWDLHDESLPPDWSPSISEGLGLPPWTNHLAFDAYDLPTIESHKRRWLDHGLDVFEVDHGWCCSIYTRDPNGILVEFCATTQPFRAEDRAQAQRVLEDPSPPLEPTPKTLMHRAIRPAKPGA